MESWVVSLPAVFKVLFPASLVLAVLAGKLPDNVVDMSYPFDDLTIYWPTAKPFKLSVDFRNKTDQGYWYEGNSYAAAEHGGTHLDAPAHFHEGKWRVDDIPVKRLIAEGIVIDIKEKAKTSPVAQLDMDDITAWEKANGNIPKGSIVFMNSGWQSRWPNKTLYLGTSTNDTSILKFPGFHPNAAMLLVHHRDVYGLGVDTPSLDYGPSKSFTVHTSIFKENVYGLENVANLDKIPKKGATVYALPMKITDGSGAPCRIVATWDGSAISAAGSKFAFTFLRCILTITLISEVIFNIEIPN